MGASVPPLPSTAQGRSSRYVHCWLGGGRQFTGKLLYGPQITQDGKAPTSNASPPAAGEHANAHANAMVVLLAVGRSGSRGWATKYCCRVTHTKVEAPLVFVRAWAMPPPLGATVQAADRRAGLLLQACNSKPG
jgi:hypothetical protein